MFSIKEGKPENPEKKPLEQRMRTNNKLNPLMVPGRSQTQATLVSPLTPAPSLLPNCISLSVNQNRIMIQPIVSNGLLAFFGLIP